MRQILRTASVLLAGLAVVALGYRYAPETLFEADEDTSPVEFETGTTQIRTLAESYSTDGTIGFAEAIGAFARLDSVGNANTATILTEIVAEGSTAERGDVLWRLGFEPTVALYGDQPSYRTLARNDVGEDVRLLEENLVALGFDPDSTVTIDGDFTAATEAMVERWQDAIGADVTGEVGIGAVVYIPEIRRIGPVGVQVGDSVSDGVRMLTLTGDTRVVSMIVSAANRTTVALGDVIELRLPDRSTVVATVADLVVGDAGETSVTARVDAEVISAADQIPVTASWSVELVANAVTVPESALIRTDSAQYYVEVHDPSGDHRLVADGTGP